MQFSNKLPAIDPRAERDFIVDFINDQVKHHYKRDGIVVGISGGIDSAITAVVSQMAVGNDKFKAVLLPEKESNPISTELGIELADKFDMSYSIEDITPVLEGFGAYETRDNIVKKYFPEYDGTQKWKIVQPGNLLEKDNINFYSLKLESPSETKSKRLQLRDLRTIIGATDLKQRTRMAKLYQVAETENYIVAGTTNLSETYQGFYVKYGDGGVDIEPLAYLYKTYIYQLADFLGIPEGIIKRPPSPDTFSSEVSDDEFFFRMPYQTLDLFLWAVRDEIPPQEVSKKLDIDQEKVVTVMNDIRRKYNASSHLRIMPASPDKVLP
ncbi:MAG: NAD(+) synthase [Aliifodinibius sp.]|nr:NAD(+) synthase [candidate division Zixibacteria bacterium]NIT60952.1 NAD(+) synthase [Fodinibius sp.]NIW40065.1 NAD(+) synthase [candidate division Zixibacteria bacterium]NIX58930.1 NAD(+) synthase [candidate division Zixibacteria bacterium]NIY29533.1 NAD(+) synthase [Fodinibius sp.]